MLSFVGKRLINTSLGYRYYSSKMTKSVLVPIADGFEEIEAITIIDVLKRAGANVTVASITGKNQVKGAHGVQITTDDLFSNIKNNSFDLISLPGGYDNATSLGNCAELVELLKKQKSENKWYTAICASPALVFAKNGLLNDKAVCYPAGPLNELVGSKLNSEARVLVDKNCVTSKGPGTSMEFSLELVSLLFGEEKKNKLIGEMIVKF
ncbi:hypothetical protein DLAC_00550 [Tieghemostelium lacteum]|uniref:DJ-1/PfpI domain-containing protein n=1 Tax=Tieghemostelium lacteum TaxID=361077 RepID=A0A152AA10_TIELA|nr:hypothetical protein DLAC_00550 [Tieghemostelium lacteum]|eukprot:KYR03058.1 hypothetical protein DLAC_00550 [Tieghemostelium lacteum]